MISRKFLLETSHYQLYFSQTEGSCWTNYCGGAGRKVQRVFTFDPGICTKHRTQLTNYAGAFQHTILTTLYESEPIAEARKAVQENLASQRQRKLAKS